MRAARPLTASSTGNSMMMRLGIFVLVLLFVFLQYKLWLDNGSVSDVWGLKSQLDNQVAKNIDLRERNATLETEVNDLKSGKQSVQERARSELGMVKHGEDFYQFVPNHPAK